MFRRTLTLAGLVVGIGILIAPRTDLPSLAPESLSDHTAGRTEVTLPLARASASNENKLVIPPIHNLREEVENDPHSPPPSLLAFAYDLAPIFGEAMENESAAKSLSKQLTECALSNDSMITVRALCTRKLVQLSHKYGFLRKPVDVVLTQVDREVLRLAN